MNSIDLLGLIAAILSGFLYVPQVYHMISRKSTRDVSYIFLFISVVVSILWIIYAVYEDSVPLLLCDGIILILTLIMIGSKVYYENYYIYPDNDNNNNI